MVLALVVDLVERVERVVHSSKHGKVDHPSSSTWDTLGVQILDMDIVSLCLVDVGIGNCNHTSVWLH